MKAKVGIEASKPGCQSVYLRLECYRAKMTGQKSDVYFALYCMAMGTGRARAPQEIARLVADAGFGEVRVVPTYRPFVTGVVTAVKPR